MRFINETGLRSLLVNIMNGINTRIAERIVGNISDTSDDNHVPSAKAVYSYVNSMIASSGSTKVFEYVTGPIENVTNPNTNIIYLQRDNESDKVYTQYIYVNNEFVPIGNAELGDDRVTEIFNEVFTSTAPDLTVTTPEGE